MWRRIHRRRRPLTRSRSQCLCWDVQRIIGRRIESHRACRVAADRPRHRPVLALAGSHPIRSPTQNVAALNSRRGSPMPFFHRDQLLGGQAILDRPASLRLARDGHIRTAWIDLISVPRRIAIRCRSPKRHVGLSIETAQWGPHSAASSPFSSAPCQRCLNSAQTKLVASWRRHVAPASANEHFYVFPLIFISQARAVCGIRRSNSDGNPGKFVL